MSDAGWRSTTLGDVAERIDYGFTTKAIDDPVGPKFLRITDIVPTHIDWDRVPHCLVPKGKQAKFLLEQGDIVIARTGATVGYAKQLNVLSEPTVFASYLVRVRPSDGVDSRFLGHLVESEQYKSYVKRVAGGAAQPNANARVLAEFEFQLPPREVQKKIGATLASISDLIEINRRRTEILEEMARLLYREWFVNFRFPGHEGVQLVDSDLGPVPAGWTVAPFSHAVEIRPKVPVSKDEECPFLSMGDLSETGMSCTPSEVRSGGSGSKFMNGDTLFARITPCLENGKTGFVQTLPDGQAGRGSTEFIVFRARLMSQEMVYLLAREPGLRAHAVKSMVGASGRQRVRNECFDDYQLAVPPTSIVDDFSHIVRPMFDLTLLLARQTEVLAAARDLLLPRLVSGELDVSELELDPEAVG